MPMVQDYTDASTLLLLAKEYGFQPGHAVLIAQTKGKVERFNRYLKAVYCSSLQASLRAEGQLDVQTANACIGRATKCRMPGHGTTRSPNQRLVKERDACVADKSRRKVATFFNRCAREHTASIVYLMRC